MEYSVGSVDWQGGRTTRLPGDRSVTRQQRIAVSPLHAVEVETRDSVPDDATSSATALCGAEVWLFRQNWPEAALPQDRCRRCNELTT